MRKSLFLALLALCLFCIPAQAIEKDKFKDYIFSGMKNYEIDDQALKDYDAIKIKFPKAETQDFEERSIEGKYASTKYVFVGKDTTPSILQVRKVYENAVQKLGGSILYEEDSLFHGKFNKDGKEYYIIVHAYNGGYVYEISIVEPGELEEVVDVLDANAIVSALETKGQISLYINFDTAKATIKPDSESVIDEVVKALESKPDMKVKLEGHTDNVGNAEANQKLSEDRANAVMEAIAAKGIDKTRLSAEGFGMTKPIADNATEEGRAQNRRVELVKQ